MCGATRLLVPAFLVGVGVSSLTGSDLDGWLAAALTVAVLVAVQKVRGTAASCPISPRSGVARRPEDDRSADAPPRVPAS